MRVILHIDFNSYFATIEQQANPRLRGKPIGVTGGDRLERTVLGAASVEAKKFGIKTGMHLFEAQKLCPNLIIVKGDSNKYLECTKKFLNILKDYSPFLEVFSIDEAFVELPTNESSIEKAIEVAQEIKLRVRDEIGEWVTCSVGISYNKLMAKLAGSLYKPDGLVVIADPQSAMFILDRIGLDEVCGIGRRTKRKLNSMGIFDFKSLRQSKLTNLLASFKSYGQKLHDISLGLDQSVVTPFYQKEEIKSVGHRHTLSYDSENLEEIRQLLLKLSELISRKLRTKKLKGKTVTLWYRAAFNIDYFQATGSKFYGQGAQSTIIFSDSGLDIFKAGWKLFLSIWQKEKIRMIGISISNLKSKLVETQSFLEEDIRNETIVKALDKINNKYGEFTLQRGILLSSIVIKRKPNPFLSDRRFNF